MGCGCGKNSESKVDLKVNGNAIDLNPFMKDIISSCVKGLLKPLRDVDTIEKVELVIEK